jgi:hypothetical protein
VGRTVLDLVPTGALDPADPGSHVRSAAPYGTHRSFPGRSAPCRSEARRCRSPTRFRRPSVLRGRLHASRLSQEISLQVSRPLFLSDVPSRRRSAPLRLEAPPRARRARPAATPQAPQSHFWRGRRRATAVISPQVGEVVVEADSPTDAAPSNQAEAIQEPPPRSFGPSSDSRRLRPAG